ncbi:MAG: cupin domain-containing protein [Nitrospirae bacterium]|nr:cupin domain-containing protein [Nitrospirota bacterium]MBI3595131.1 cupin domain-containing protein [Nitrospirota bacterium]
MGIRGFRGSLWIDPPGQVWRNYIHDVDELVMLVEGEVEIEMNGLSFHLKRGEEFLIPAYCDHTVRNAGKGRSRWLYSYKTNTKNK